MPPFMVVNAVSFRDRYYLPSQYLPILQAFESFILINSRKIHAGG